MGDESAAPIPLDLFRTRSNSTHAGRLTGPRGGARLPGPLRVAFLGRTSTEEQQDPTLSIPRQLNNCRAVLPDHAVIVAHFYDIESGRKDLAARGRGRGHERFTIPVPREGGIQDLLEESIRPDRRFDAVICESVERIARRTYIGTLIENKLEDAGVPLLASDEPIALGGKRATQVLTRRVKQGVAEWYVLELLEKSWGGFEVHTQQGFNVGKPPYGYLADKIPHPVPARRADGASKHKLIPDPQRGPVVTQIFEWRVGERLGYKAIANRLNLDLGTYPPPMPVDPARAVGKWTHSSVREILTNPKHTGYMVWNRRATKTASGKQNPPEAWVWSNVPCHEPLVTKETFIAAQQVAGRRERSRDGSGANINHPHTKRSYRLRSYLVCDQCGRRMAGKRPRGVTYYVCAPPKGYVPPGHPKSIWIREDDLMDGVADFFATHIFGANRRAHVGTAISLDSERAVRDHQARIQAARAAIKDLETRRDRLVRTLELADHVDEELIRDISTRAAQLSSDRNARQAELADLERARPEQPCPELLDLLPIGPAAIHDLPEDLQRRLFEAFRLEMRCDRPNNTVSCQVTIVGPAIHTQRKVMEEALEHSPATPETGPNTARVVSSLPSVLCPQRDSNPCCRRERAVS